MAYEPIQWKDHVVAPGNTYDIVKNDDETVTLTPTGTVIQQGTNMSATNFNHMEAGILSANELAENAAAEIEKLQAKDTSLTTSINSVRTTATSAKNLANETATKVQNLEWITIEKTLTNSEEYPFNNSKQAVALPQSRNQLEYTVTAEVLSYSGGFPGDIEISDKLQNGFKVAFTGSAKSVAVKLYVKGGYIYDSGNH